MSHTDHLSPIDDIIADAKAGRMFILVDDEDRENEGDLVIPAQKADAQAVNFMAKYGRGLICLALEKQQVEALGLPLMAQHNSSRHQTAFTVSIEAREGVTTGISAADRARTVAVAINPDSRSSSIASPGHVFPLQARDGGVLVRAGHTEAAVDISRLAGLHPSGVICEIMNDDGSMARLPDLIPFAKQHGLKIATIADLIAYRRRSEKLVELTHESDFESNYGGTFTIRLYTSRVTGIEHVALIKGDVSGDDPALVRMHGIDVLSDVLGRDGSKRLDDLHASMRRIGEVGRGVIVLLREPRKDILSQKLTSAPDITTPSDLRDYGIGAQILQEVGVKEMTLLTNHPRQPVGLEGYGLEIVGFEGLE